MVKKKDYYSRASTVRTASALATLAFLRCIKSGASTLAKKFTEAAMGNLDELHQKIVYNEKSFSL